MIDSSKEVHQNTRISYIDVFKGIGIIIVVCGHVYSQLISWASPCMIPLFFIASGYCTTHPVKSGRKFQRLMLPYVLFTVTLMIIYLDFKLVNFVGSAYSRWCLYPYGTKPNIFFFRIGNGPLWFLTSMFVSFILYKPIQTSSTPWLYVFFYLVATYLLSFLPILLPWSADTAFLMAVFIFIGSYIREKKLLDKLSIPVLLGLALIYCLFTMLCGNINLSVRLYGTSLFLFFPTAVIGSLLLMRFSILIDSTLIGHLLQRIGCHSLPIFCLHIPFINLWRRLLSTSSVAIHPAISVMLVIVLVLVVTYPLAIFFDILLEKMKVLFN